MTNAAGGGDAAAARIFRYVVRIDRGGSPNPYHGWCSLAVCKPQIRRAARVGDWIVGLRSRAHDQVVCAMRVDELPTLDDYWHDPRFRAKRPRAGGGQPDNFYRAGRHGALVQVDNPLHDGTHAARDISGRHAIVSWRFWYFGDRSPELPTDLIHLVHSGQGHSLAANRRPGDVPALAAWLAHWPMGTHGSPIDASSVHRSRGASLAGATPRLLIRRKATTCGDRADGHDPHDRQRGRSIKPAGHTGPTHAGRAARPTAPGFHREAGLGSLLASIYLPADM